MTVTEGLGDQSSRLVTTSAALAGSSAPVAAAPVVAKASAKAKAAVIGADGRLLVPRSRAKPKPTRFYAVVSGPSSLLGVWHAQWAIVEAALPGGKLFGSGVRLFGYDTQSEADEKWFEYWESTPVRHPRQQ